jgi:hypothetical protein
MTLGNREPIDPNSHSGHVAPFLGNLAEIAGEYLSKGSYVRQNWSNTCKVKDRGCWYGRGVKRDRWGDPEQKFLQNGGSVCTFIS